jgi:opacity protein-like surface antigen
MTINIQLYILIVFSIISSAVANAQMTIGLEGGITSNKLDFKNNYSNVTLLQRKGTIINIDLNYKFNKWFTLEMSPGMLEKNYSLQNSNRIYQNVTNCYLQLPISLKHRIKLLRKLNAFGSLGVYYAYWLESKVDGLAPNVFELYSNSENQEMIKLEEIKYTYSFDSRRDNRSEFGWAGKIGMDYGVYNNLSLSLKGHYYQSLTDQQKKIVELQNPKLNKTFVTTIGLIYHLD